MTLEVSPSKLFDLASQLIDMTQLGYLVRVYGSTTLPSWRFC